MKCFERVRAEFPFSSTFLREAWAGAVGRPASLADMRGMNVEHSGAFLWACLLGAAAELAWEANAVALLWEASELPERLRTKLRQLPSRDDVPDGVPAAAGLLAAA